MYPDKNKPQLLNEKDYKKLLLEKDFKQLQSENIKKCLTNPAFFMKKWCKIQHPTKGKVNFNLYKFQEKTLNEFRNNKRNIVLKSRQMGISTLVAGYSLWLMLFHSDKNVLVIATKQDVAKSIITKLREMHDNLPSWLKQVYVENNRLSIRFKNGSQIKAESSSPTAGRSHAVSLLVIDECAFVNDIDEIWAGAASTLSTGGDAILLSTPNGIGNFFHKVWIQAESGIADASGFKFNPICLKWNLHPERDQNWRDAQTAELGEKKAGQECDCDFISSGNTVIDSNILIKYKEQIVKPPIEQRYSGQELWIWKYADPNKHYIVAADVSRGDALDFSTFQVIDIDTLEQVAEYQGKIDTKIFAKVLINIATEYNEALLVIENSNIGWAVIQEVLDKSYKNLYYSNDDTVVVDDSKINNRLNAQDKKSVPGFTMSSRTRPLIISKLHLYMTDPIDPVKAYSARLNLELFTFIWNEGKPGATRGYNDDLVISYGIALWIKDTALRLRNEQLISTKKALEGITKTGYDGVYGPHMRGRQSNLPRDPWKLNLGNGNQEDMDWLLSPAEKQALELERKRKIENTGKIIWQ